ncbi:hypothetical protein U27_06649 [Candidatus Vecturithrix granuli]|uniref:Uncharacterized protein n=1 Tax=Vecturithrix granuli TaxID=1499967 RepID=A0A081C509_VECG1|nr:hypothetical protein U27_06649 [Candidatus Vecturithrix granuli]
MEDLKLLRWTGITGVIGAILLFTGDMFLFGSWLSGQETLAENWRLMSRFSPLRLMIGGILGPISTIFYGLGCWHFYLALKPGGKQLGFLVFLTYTSGMIIGGAYQAASPVLGFFFHVEQALGQEGFDLLSAATLQYLTLLFTIAQIFGIIGSLLFIFLVLFRSTRYPRWMIFVTPPVILFTRTIFRHFPAPLGGNLLAGYINLGFLLIFGVSLKILWHGGRRITP